MRIFNNLLIRNFRGDHMALWYRLGLGIVRSQVQIDPVAVVIVILTLALGFWLARCQYNVTRYPIKCLRNTDYSCGSAFNLS